MKIVDPTVPSPTHNHVRAPALSDLHGLKIGLLSNGKSNADALIQKTANLLIAKYGGSSMDIKYKRHPSQPAQAELLTQLNHEADYIITAAGD